MWHSRARLGAPLASDPCHVFHPRRKVPPTWSNSMKWKLTLGLALAASLAVAPEASAQAFAGPVASNAYISFNGLDWAWASPCPAQPESAGCGGGININGGGGGWRFASA